MRFTRAALTAVLVTSFLGACSSTKAHTGAVGATPTGPVLRNADGVADHWHAALGVNVCGHWQPGPIWPNTGDGGFGMTLTRHDDPGTYAGLHTHQLSDGSSDGVIHMEPAQPDEAGRNATLGKYMTFGGWRANARALRLWQGADGRAIVVQAGQRCGTQSAVVRWATGHYTPGRSPRLVEQHGDPSKLQLTDDQVIALYFVAKSTGLASLGGVPSVANLPDANRGTPAPTLPHAITTTTASRV